LQPARDADRAAHRDVLIGKLLAGDPLAEQTLAPDSLTETQSTA
jgi:hypothetical protein